MTQPTHIQPADLGDADRELKSKHRGMWASGNYHAVVTDIVSELGPILVNAGGITPGECWTWRPVAATSPSRRHRPGPR
jgi:hypothetical protein